ncbi:uncharacterized protein [Nicotiana sylvestris]|uniref:uncharacterized protein n=1 Tax=Nicotiana sylvestris TaxID=4096 RepID=UPI00388C693D
MSFINNEPEHSFGVLDQSGPSESYHLHENAYHGISSHYDFENEQVEANVLTQLPEGDVLNRDLADAQSEEENSDYDNNVDESGDDTPFHREDGDEEDEKEEPDLTREYAPPPDEECMSHKCRFIQGRFLTLITCQTCWMWKL